MDISPLQEFVGQVVGVTETPRVLELKNLKTKHEYVEHEIVEGDATIAELRARAGARLRIWLPGTVGIMNYDLSRVNAHIEKSEDGVFRITKVDLG